MGRNDQTSIVTKYMDASKILYSNFTLSSGFLIDLAVLLKWNQCCMKSPSSCLIFSKLFKGPLKHTEGTQLIEVLICHPTAVA